MSSNNQNTPADDNQIFQIIEVGGQKFEMRGSVNITLKPVSGNTGGSGGGGGTSPPPPPQPTDPTKPDKFKIKEGGWGANMDPKTWIRTTMKDDPNLFKVIDDNKKNVATHFETAQAADNFIVYFQRHPDQVSTLEGSSQPGTGGGGGGTPGGNGGTVTPGVDEVAGIKLPYKTTGKARVDDWHYNANDGLRADFEGNPKDGSYTNNVAVFYGTFLKSITTKEDRAVKWSWGRHTGSGTKVNTYIVNLRNGDGATRSRMEVTHPNGYETMVDWDEQMKGTPAKVGQLWGIMGVRRNVQDASGKVVAVRLELYEDQGIVNNQPGNKWVKLLEHNDTKYLTTTYPNGMEVTGRFDDDAGDKNIKISKALIAEVEPVKA